VIRAHGHFLIADNPDAANGPTVTYGLNGYPGIQARGADSDTGWSLDLPDNGGVALFNTGKTANMAAGTLIDAAGFSSIAAGLFKEGAGIPAISGSTPTGQVAFQRIWSGSGPQDTGANETDFRFVDPVSELLGVMPLLGAAGPENLDAPIHRGTGGAVAAAPLDPGGSGPFANVVRDSTPGSGSTSSFGTLTFRRTLTNNTGADLTALRYRVVSITSTPVGSGSGDVRLLTAAANAAVTLSDGTSVAVRGSTLETPPTQALGGAYGSSVAVGGVALATPFVAGSSLNVQFTVGVQVQGPISFCLVAEGTPAVASASLCFSDAGATFAQPASRWFANTNTADVGSPLAAQDTAATAPHQGTAFRLRALVLVGSGGSGLPGGESFKLQYAERVGTCDTAFVGEVYKDVQAGAGAIRFFDNPGVANGAAATANGADPIHLDDVIHAESYVEANPFSNGGAIAPSEDGLWDFSLVDVSSPIDTSYCFRVVRSEAGLLGTYSVVPEIITTGPSCMAATTCSGHGSCALDGSCVCAGNFTGADCSTCSGHFTGAACDTCATDYYGTGCDVLCQAAKL
jgi:hypothetical protein